MKTYSVLLVALASAPAALAHTVFTDFYVNGMPQGDGVAMRMNPNKAKASSPISSLDSDDMACNAGGTKGVSRVQPVPDGALLTFEIRAWPDNPSKERLDRGHKGSCAVYLKKVDDAVTDTAAGDGWFKIFDHGYNSATKRWCTDEIIDNNGLLSVKLPKGLKGGDYLARPEILALHAAKDGDPQEYTGCAQIFVQSSGNLVPESTVSIPGIMKYNTPPTDFDIYNKPASDYQLPGPPVAKLTSSAGKNTASASALVQSTGLKPEGCIMENANWCGKEVPDYSTEKACWASAQNCWDQSDVCFNTSPATGNAGCKIWQDKCKDINAKCTAGDWTGPPNKGKVLTPVKKTVDVGLVLGGDSSSGDYAAKPDTSAAPASAKQSPTPTPTGNGGPKIVTKTVYVTDSTPAATPASHMGSGYKRRVAKSF
ncbi:endoglucanase B [Pyrenophora seminiperda CCB06]|uniref:AA9 family lytic polysaccharide monooxygenase n=1 Tax=Pyrenophora seminiperda CCB06 TaxID=1302712 RepID=A0A3M7ME29_9PLEO|nr:endoglucanase B [Pyrenophora seminiperda CCB06]